MSHCLEPFLSCFLLITGKFTKTSLFPHNFSQYQKSKTGVKKIPGRAVDPHSFFADPDSAVFLNADPVPDPAAFKMRIRIQNL